MFGLSRREKVLKALYERRAELALAIRSYQRTGQTPHPYTQGTYDELNRTITLLEGRD